MIVIPTLPIRDHGFSNKGLDIAFHGYSKEQGHQPGTSKVLRNQDKNFAKCLVLGLSSVLRH